MEKKSPEDIDEYIAGFPQDVQVKLEKLRATIHQSAPGVQEKISYQMPTFFLEGNLVHFAAYKNHIGFYLTPSGIEQFKEPLSIYKGAKGSVQFPLNQPIPYGLVSEIVAFRFQENLAKAADKRKKK